MEKLKTNRNAGLYIGATVSILMCRAISSVLSFRAGNAISLSLAFGVWDWHSVLYLLFYSLSMILTVAWLVYSTVLLWGVCRDMNKICWKCGIPGSNLNYILMRLLSGVTLGIYFIVWSYQKGKNMEEAAEKYRVKIRGKGNFHLILAVLGVVFLWIYAILTAVIEGSILTPSFLVPICAFFSLAYGLMDMVNMACFIQDLNILSEKYNIQEDVVSGYLEQKASQPGGRIECCSGIYAGAQFPFEGDLVIGRDGAYAHIVIEDPKVSKKHCVIRYNPESGSYLVWDVSSNGVFYKNGQAFPKNTPAACARGTVLVIGRSGNEFILK